MLTEWIAVGTRERSRSWAPFRKNHSWGRAWAWSLSPSETALRGGTGRFFGWGRHVGFTPQRKEAVERRARVRRYRRNQEIISGRGA